jgi:hypothetical protein
MGKKIKHKTDKIVNFKQWDRSRELENREVAEGHKLGGLSIRRGIRR